MYRISLFLQAKVHCPSVRGGVVFIVREVFPEVLGWGMSTSSEQVQVLLSCLSLIHDSVSQSSGNFYFIKVFIGIVYVYELDCVKVILICIRMV